MPEPNWPDDPAEQAIAVAVELSQIGYDVKYGAPYGDTPAGRAWWQDEKRVCIRLTDRMHTLAQRWQDAVARGVPYSGPGLQPHADAKEAAGLVYATHYRSCYGETVAGFAQWAREVEEMIRLGTAVQTLEQHWAEQAAARLTG